MSIAEQQAQRFGRFGESRDIVGNDFDTYDDSDAPAPAVTLDTPIANDNVGYRMLSRMGWKTGGGLGRTLQGRKEPVPIVMKSDIMGLGRMSVEMNQVEVVTEKRRQLEIEKDDTPELIQRYMNNLEKEQHIAESTAELRQTYYCESCDKQYKTYSEYDNHVNSYDHAHRLRLKELRERDFTRKMSAHKKKKKGDREKDRDTLISQKMVALERAKMSVDRLVGKSAGGFTTAIPVDPAGSPGNSQCGAGSDDSSCEPVSSFSRSSGGFKPVRSGSPSHDSDPRGFSSTHVEQQVGSSSSSFGPGASAAVLARLGITPMSFSSNSPASNPLPPLPTATAPRPPSTASANTHLPQLASSSALTPMQHASRWGVAPPSGARPPQQPPASRQQASRWGIPPPQPVSHSSAVPPPPPGAAPPLPPMPCPDDPPPPPLPSDDGPPLPPPPPSGPPPPVASAPSLSFGFKKSGGATTSSSSSSSAVANKPKASFGFAKKKPVPFGAGGGGGGGGGGSKMVARSSAFGDDDDDDDDEESEVAPTLRGKFISGSSSRW